MTMARHGASRRGAIRVRTQLALSHLTVRPGTPARVEIEVTNTSDVIDGVTAIVDGIDPSWIRFDAPVVSLFPSSTASLGFTIDTPFDYPAGDYLVVVRVVSTIDADRQTVHDFWITVEPSLGIEMRLRPSIINGGRTAEVFATVGSTGNTTAMIAVTALDPGRQVDCRVVVPDLAVPPATEATTIIRLRGPRPWFGQPASRSIVVAARSDDIVVEEIVTFNQKPRIPRGVLTFFLLAAIIALWATIFLLVANALGSDDSPGKATASKFKDGGAANVPLAAIAGAASGKVTAATTGEGLARITVEAFRLDAAGDTVPSGSAATDESGNYELKSLLPGTYKLRFSAEGFDPLWYPDAASEDDAAPIERRAEEAGAGTRRRALRGERVVRRHHRGPRERHRACAHGHRHGGDRRRGRTVRGHPAVGRRDQPAGAAGAGDIHHPRRGVRLRATRVRGESRRRRGQRAEHRQARRRHGQRLGNGRSTPPAFHSVVSRSRSPAVSWCSRPRRRRAATSASSS